MNIPENLKDKISEEILNFLKDFKAKKWKLKDTQGKKLLINLIGPDLSFNRSEIEELLNKDWPYISSALKAHKIKIPRQLYFRYSDDSLRVAADCYRRSLAFAADADKNQLKDIENEMISAVKSLQEKIGDFTAVNLNSLRRLARELRKEDLKRIGREEIELPFRWGKKITQEETSNNFPESGAFKEIQLLAYQIREILDKRKNKTVAELSRQFNVSKKTVIESLDFLKKYYLENEGNTIYVAGKIRGTVKKVSPQQLEKPEDAFQGFETTTKVLVLSHLLLGNKFQQPTILHTIMADAAKEGVKFAVVVGGLVAGKPQKGTYNEIFLASDSEQIDYVVKYWPKTPFKTYILAGDEELSWKFNLAEAICSNPARSDLRYLGDYAAKRPIEGTDTILEFVYPKGGVKRTYTIGYRPQRHARALITALFPKIRKEGLKGLPRVIFNGRVLSQGEINRGAKSVLCPGLISQTPSLAAAEVVPSAGAIICEFRFNKNGNLIPDFDQDGKPQEGGIIVKYYDYSPYVVENDYGEFPEYDDCTPHEKRMLGMLKEKPCTEGEISRALNCSIETAKALFESLQERGFKVEFSEAAKRIVWVPNLKEKFEPLNIKIKAQYLFGATSDSHLGSKYQQPSLLKMAHNYAADVWKAKFITDGGDSFDGRHVYRGQEAEVFAETFDEQLKAGIENWPNRLPAIIIGGNHDEKFWKELISDFSRHFKVVKHPEITRYFDIARQFAEKHGDIIYLGADDLNSYCTEARLVINQNGEIVQNNQENNNLVILLSHPSGAAGQFRSYKGQKYSENLLEYILSLVLHNVSSLKEMPHIYMLGNWHINGYFRYGGIDIYILPCFQAQTPYLKAKGLTPDIGSWMVRAELDEYGYIFINTVKYLDLIPWVKKNDYKID